MQAAATLRNPILADSNLADTIAELGAEFSSMRGDLHKARGEIARLEGTLAKLLPRYRAMPRVDLGALRRRVAYHCHPDRGGDADLMSSLNALFDFLEGVEGLAGGAVPMIHEAKRTLSQLLEINRALAQDLDVSHRDAADLARERDALVDQIDELRAEVEELTGADERGQNQADAEEVHGRLAEEQRKNEQLREEMEVLLLDCQAARARAYRAEERSSALVESLRLAEQDRDGLCAQLDQWTEAMEEIRYRLFVSLDDSQLRATG